MAFQSLRRSRKLRKISGQLARPTSSVESSLSGEKESALDQLLDLCESDPDISRVVESAGLDREALTEIYWRLMAAGAGQWVGGRFVAAATLAYPETLEYAIRELGPDADPRPVAFRLIEYFEGGRTGQV